MVVIILAKPPDLVAADFRLVILAHLSTVVQLNSVSRNQLAAYEDISYAAFTACSRFVTLA